MRVWQRVVVVFSCLLVPAQALAGWTQPAGEAYVKAWGHFVSGSKAFGIDDTYDVEGYTFVSANVYGEYGLHDDWTLVGSFRPYGWAKYGEASSHFMGTQEIGIRRSILKGALPVAIQAQYGFAPPVGDGDLAEDASAVAFRPTVSTHQTSLEVTVGYGLSFGWLKAGTGVQWFSNAKMDPAIFASFQFGAILWDTAFTLHSVYFQPLGPIEAVNVSGAGQTAYLGIGLGISRWLTEHFGLTLGFDGAAFAKSNAGAPVLQGGMQLRF